jgi:hypothetical protein
MNSELESKLEKLNKPLETRCPFWWGVSQLKWVVTILSQCLTFNTPHFECSYPHLSPNGVGKGKN